MHSVREIATTALHAVWYGSHPLRYGLLLPLLPVSLLMAGVAGVRCGWYRLARPKPASVPVIVVGNLTVGGSGKTPLVAALAEYLKRKGYHPGIVSRGYAGVGCTYPHQVRAEDTAAEVGDEPLLLQRKTACPVVIDPDRRRALAHLLEHHAVDVVLSDDGLQHYRLPRQLEIVVVDGQRRFGNGWLLPAGPLREPVSRLDSADMIVVNGAETWLSKQLSMCIKPLGFEHLKSGKRLGCDAFAGRTVHACAGIAHPQRFFNTLKALDVEVLAHAYPDHYHYRAADLDFADNRPVVVTEKDAVKCRDMAGEGVWVLQVEAVPQDEFWQQLNHHIPPLNRNAAR